MTKLTLALLMVGGKFVPAPDSSGRSRSVIAVLGSLVDVIPIYP